MLSSTVELWVTLRASEHNLFAEIVVLEEYDQAADKHCHPQNQLYQWGEDMVLRCQFIHVWIRRKIGDIQWHAARLAIGSRKEESFAICLEAIVLKRGISFTWSFVVQNCDCLLASPR